MTKREIETCSAQLEPYTRYPIDDLDEWFTAFQKTAILIHSDEGVIWGRVDENGKAVLRSATVEAPNAVQQWQQVRIFSDVYEVHVWCSDDGVWQGRKISEAVATDKEIFTYAIDEQHLLWGNRASDAENGFTYLSDASQGLTHIIPLPFDQVDAHVSQRDHYVALHVRHYLEESPDTGVLRVAASRLVKFDYVRPETENGEVL